MAETTALTYGLAALLAGMWPQVIPLTDEPDKRLVQWQFVDGTQGWEALHSVALTAEQGALAVKVTGHDPYFAGPAISVPADKGVFLEVRLSTTKATALGVFFSTVEKPGFLPENHYDFPLQPDGQRHTYRKRIADHQNWKGEITRLRFDPEPADCADPDVRVESIALIDPGGALSVDWVSPDRQVVVAGQPFELRAKVRNVGTTAVANLGCALSAPPETAVIGASPAAPLATGEGREFSWQVQYEKLGPANLQMKLSADGQERLAHVSLPCHDPRVLTPDAPGAITVGNDNVRLQFWGDAGEAEGATLFVAREGKWELSGTWYPLIHLAVPWSEGGTEVWCRSLEIEKRSAKQLKLARKRRLGTSDFLMELEVAADDSSPTINVTGTLWGEGEVSAFYCPVLSVGDNAFGERRDLGIFPGLEYLVADEQSSNTLDIYPPGNTRYAPDPLKVTIPLMTHDLDGTTVGLLWDNQQKWDGRHRYPSPVFASPDFLTGQKHHLMALFAPSVPDLVPENKLKAATPFRLNKGESIKLESTIYAKAGATSFDVIREYVKREGMPAVELPRSLKEELQLCREAYLHTSWGEEERGWIHALWHGKWKPTWQPHIPLALKLDSLLSADPGREAARQRAEETITERLKAHGPGALGDTLAFHLGYLDEALQMIERQARNAAKSQREDGSWPFTPDERRRPLGEPGATSVGTCAGPALSLLRHASMTGDAQSLAAAKKALDRMAQFRVPRGSQTWEIALHTPDILASGHACSAFLQGYELTGEKRYLDQAVYWAWTGVPFVYLWSHDDYEILRYATIPVFGATFFRGSWFGRPVQWCGLAYALPLHKLAKYDDSFDWGTLARGILASGMRQQHAEGQYQGTYPDYWVYAGNKAEGPRIEPNLIVRNVLALAGHSLDLHTRTIRRSEAQWQATSSALIDRAGASAAELQLGLRWFPGEASYTLLTRPVAFEVEGVTIDTGANRMRLRHVENLRESRDGWTFATGANRLAIKVAHASGDAETVRVTLK